MADSKNALPWSFQDGHLNDFVQGMKESSDNKSKAFLTTAGTYAGVRAWQVYRAARRKKMRGK
jgi:hypothetical protein